MESTLIRSYVHVNEPMQAVHLSKELNNLGIQIDLNTGNLTTLGRIDNSQILVKSDAGPIGIIQGTAETVPQKFEVLEQQDHPCIVQIQILYPQDFSLSTAPNAVKRGRPKKKRPGESSVIKCEPSQAPKSARTRSGRLVKLPKHMEKDFKKIETSADKREIQVADFERFEGKQSSTVEFTELHPKKRVISAQYKCPKCLKAYLGKNKMIQHLKKYPDHGPLPEGYQEYNFDVWNYLFDITQKCKPGQRGVKFCEELSNLLHNVQLLKSALFKTVTDSKNCVHIDKVLGNAIGLSPGKYKFDENELYKDVTVLKLITNTEFFKPNFSNKRSSDSVTIKNKHESEEYSESKKLKQSSRSRSDSTSLDNTYVTEEVGGKTYENSFPQKTNNTNSKPKCESTVEQSGSFPKKDHVDSVDNPGPLTSDLLSENLLLHSLPNPRSSVDELILTSVDNGSNLLDNSTSSDEVMNVDQFVNERFKKIIEPDIELSNASLNLDLPSLELFQFHTS